MRKGTQRLLSDSIQIGSGKLTVLPLPVLNWPYLAAAKKQEIENAVKAQAELLWARIWSIYASYSPGVDEVVVRAEFDEQVNLASQHRASIGLVRGLPTIIFMIFTAALWYLVVDFYTSLRVFEGPARAGLSASVIAGFIFAAAAIAVTILIPPQRLSRSIGVLAICALIAASLYFATFLPAIIRSAGSPLDLSTNVPLTALLTFALGVAVALAKALASFCRRYLFSDAIPQRPETAISEIILACLALNRPAPLSTLYRKRVVIDCLRSAAWWFDGELVAVLRRTDSAVQQGAREAIASLRSHLLEAQRDVVLAKDETALAVLRELLKLYVILMTGTYGELRPVERNASVSVLSRVLVAVIPFAIFIPIAVLQTGAPPLLVGAFLVGSVLWLLGGLAPLVDPEARSSIAALRQIFVSAKADDASGGK